MHEGLDTDKTTRTDSAPFEASRYRALNASHLDRIPQLSCFDAERRFAMRVVASVLPFRTNAYVVEQLIDWTKVPDDPLFQLTFPQPDMLSNEQFDHVAALLRRDADKAEVQEAVDSIRAQLNPHPGGQMTMNVPSLDGRPLSGLQHKYRETVLFFPSQGQTCHAYCSFCFRWAQFIGDKEIKFASNETRDLHEYLTRHHEVTDLLITGGDPMVMRASNLADILEPLLEREFQHVRTLRIGTKSLSFWPYRYLDTEDAQDTLALFERVVAAGKQLAFMAHVNHARELETPAVREAIRRIRATGAVLRSQAPLLRHINDTPDVWARMWRMQVQLGMQPYYMFVERDTGARRYFEVPLTRAMDIYRRAVRKVSGLARTARGPVMSAAPGKVEVQGQAEIHGERVFVLRFLQARNPAWVQRPFFARFDPEATWFDQLRPAFGEERFFFEEEFDAMRADHADASRRTPPAPSAN